jgi:hypothetical protein
MDIHAIKNPIAITVVVLIDSPSETDLCVAAVFPEKANRRLTGTRILYEPLQEPREGSKAQK